MKNKLLTLYNQCIKELNSIGINILDEKIFGKIDISISNRSSKNYGYCKQEEPNKKYISVRKYNHRRVIKYQKFNVHHIKINRWVLDLDDKIIKNTIMHELIHCIPYCNDHGVEFKKYARYINEKLGYNISRVGNKKEDYNKSNLEYIEEKEGYNYKIVCSKCGQTIFRKRLNRNFLRKYRCGICNGRFSIKILN